MTGILTHKSPVINGAYYGMMHNTSWNKAMLTIMHYYELLCMKGIMLFNKVEIIHLSHIILIQKFAVTCDWPIIFNFIGRWWKYCQSY